MEALFVYLKYFVVVLHTDLRYERGNEPRGWVFREAPRLAYWRRVRESDPSFRSDSAVY